MESILKELDNYILITNKRKLTAGELNNFMLIQSIAKLVLKQHFNKLVDFKDLNIGDTINYDMVCNFKLNGKPQKKLINKTQTVYEKESDFIRLKNPLDTHSTIYRKEYFNNNDNLTNIAIIENY